jgi:tRNA(adenine34) deaminase
MQILSDADWMKIALEEARSAFLEDEVPVGALLIKDSKLLFRDHNRSRQTNNPLAHAESLVINKAIRNGFKYLNDFTLYVTLEPCIMCAGIIIWSRIGRVVYGCRDSKAGAAGSIYNALWDKSFNHNPDLTTGILEKDAQLLLTEFFQAKR